MASATCRGLPGDWLNSWLAAVGSTVLDSRLRLRWTTEPIPVAVLSVESDEDPLDVLVSAWPTADRLEAMPIAQRHGDLAAMKRIVPVDVFVERARTFRSHPDVWTLSSTVTDLGVYKGGEVAHAPLDPKGPGTIKWLHHRLLKTYRLVENPEDQIRRSLSGRGQRVVDNGLGFDLTRLTTQADGSAKLVDPIIEVLAFFGLALLPVRSSGLDMTLPGVRARPERRQRGWRRDPRWCFEWPVWRQDLDSVAVDALLDVWRDARTHHGRERLGVHAAWRTVGYLARGSNDNTVAYGSERL
ncbi:MAG: hypothetical protein OXI26_12320 [bacterium]|nr:hypothetical protein [bacterium]